MEENKREVIDLRDKSDEEIFEAYKEIAKETKVLDSVWTITQNLDDAIEVSKKIKKIQSQNK